MTITLLHFQVLSAALFCIGIYGVLARRSAVLILLALELMLNAVNINLIAYAAYLGHTETAGTSSRPGRSSQYSS